MVCSLIVSGLHFPSQSVRQPMDLMKSMINKLGPIFNNVCSQQATDNHSGEKERQLHGHDIFKYPLPVCEAVLVAHGLIEAVACQLSWIYTLRVVLAVAMTTPCRRSPKVVG